MNVINVKETEDSIECLRQVSSCEAVETRIADAEGLRASRPRPSFLNMFHLRPSACIGGSHVFSE
jgi:hypothetical protein